MKKTLLLFAILISIPLSVFPIRKMSNSIIKSIEQGLPSSIVTCFEQDKNGFIWIGTEEGLCKYDGFQFQIYRIENSDSSNIANNTISSLLLDHEGNLWVGSYSGFQFFDAQLNKFTSINFNLPTLNKTRVKIERMINDRWGNIWLSTSIYGLIKYNPKEKKAIHYFHQKGNSNSIGSNVITDLACDESGNIWISTADNGITRFNQLTNEYTHFNKENGGIISNQTVRLIRLSSGQVFASVLKIGICEYSKELNKFVPLSSVNSKIPSGIVFSLVEEEQNNLILGTDGEGCLIYNWKNKQVYKHPVFEERKYEIGHSRVHALFVDQQKNLWVGIPTLGICIIKNSISGFETYRNFASSPFYDCINGVSSDAQNNVWVASDGGGVIRFNRETKEQTQYINQPSKPSSLPDNAALDVHIDKEGNAWVGTFTGGLSLMKKGSNKFVSLTMESTNGLIGSNNVRSIIEDSQGNIWIGTHGGGISKIANYGATITNYKEDKSGNKLINNWVNKLFFDNRNNLWIGTYFGISHFDTQKEIFTSYHTQNCGLSSNIIYAIAQDDEHNIWFGTEHGLNKLNAKTNKFEVFNTSNGLNSNRIKGLVYKRPNQLWISDSHGISCFNTKNRSVQTFSLDDGLQSDEFNKGSYAISKSGEIFFGGSKGVNIFHPEKLKRKENIRLVYLTDLKIFDQSILVNHLYNDRMILKKSLNETNDLYLNYGDKSFTIEFTSPEFFSPDNLKFSCFLKGFDNRWRSLPSSLRSVTYTNLDPGTYTLYIKEGDNTNEQYQKKLMIHILPPFWKTSWAYLFYTIFCFAMLLLVYRYFKQKQLSRFKAKSLEIEAIKQEELYNSKLQFFTNISHEFRTPLTLIASPLESLIKEEINHHKLQSLHIIQKNAKRLLHLINQILDLRKIDMGRMNINVHEIELSSFIKSSMEAFQDAANRKNIDLNFENKIGTTSIWFDPDMLEKCIYNLLSNAYKYTNEGFIDITIELKTKENREYTTISIADSGIGISAGAIPQLFDRYFQDSNQPASNTGSGIGLHFVKTILDLHSGLIEVTSKINEGSTFVIYILNGYQHFKNNQINHSQFKLHTSSESQPVDIEEALAIETNSEINTHTKEYTVLIIDDNADMRRMLKSELNKSYRVIEASNGSKGYELIQQRYPDLVVSDVMMPEFDGFTLCKMIKSNIEISHIPVILLTAKTELEDHLTGVENGADAYITKPFSMSYLSVMIKRLIQQRIQLKEKYSKSIHWENETIDFSSADDRLMQKSVEIIKRNLDNPALTVEMISKELGISRAQLHRKMKALIDQSPIEIIRSVRMNHAATLLLNSNLTIAEVAYAVGYNTQSYFSSSFSEFFGVSPSQFIKDKTTSE